MDQAAPELITDTRPPPQRRKEKKRRTHQAKRTPSSGIVIQGSLNDSPEELRDALDQAIPRPFAALTKQQQDAWVPYLIQDWFRSDSDPDAYEAVFRPLVGDLEGRVQTMLMNGPYLPSITWQGHGDWLRPHIDLSWSADLDHAVRFHARVEYGHKFHVHVSAPRRLGLHLEAVRRDLAEFVAQRWLMSDVVAPRLLMAFLDTAYWSRYLGDGAFFDGRGEWLG